MQLTKGHIIRNKNTKPGYMAQPYSPLNTTCSVSSLSSDYCIMFTYIPSNTQDNESQPSYICTGILEGTLDNISMVEQGYWYQQYGLAGADIKDCFMVPVYSYSDFSSPGLMFKCDTIGITPDPLANNQINIALEKTFEFLNDSLSVDDYCWDVYTNKYYQYQLDSGGQTVTWHEVDNPYSTAVYQEYICGNKRVYISEHQYQTIEYKLKLTNINTTGTIIRAKTKPITGLNITSNEINVKGIKDWNGNIIWECPYGVTITGFDTYLLLGLSHVMIEFEPTSSKFGNNLLTGRGFTYDCRHPGLFVDSYQDYVLKNRDYDIAMRQIQSEKQELQAWASTAENVGFGMAFGQGIGAVAAGIGGVIEAASTWLLNQHFDPKIQQQYDMRYSRMTDQISLIGDSITGVINCINQDIGLMQIYTLTMDSATQTRYNSDINTNGYYCDETTNNLQSLIAQGNVVQADNVTVEGLICKEGRQQIVYRLQNGVEFI